MPRAALRQGDLRLYRQMEAILREQIADGELRAGAQLPTEETLRLHYGVSRATVRQALETLERDGLIDRQVGRGTFVRERSRVGRTAGRKLRSWAEASALADGARRLVRSGCAPPPPQVAELLGERAEAPIPFFIRVSNETPRWGVKRYLHPRFAGALDVLASRQRFVSALSHLAAAPVVARKGWVEAISAEPRFAMLLNVAPGAPLLSVWWTDWVAGRAVAVTQMLHPALSFQVGECA